MSDQRGHKRVDHQTSIQRHIKVTPATQEPPPFQNYIWEDDKVWDDRYVWKES